MITVSDDPDAPPAVAGVVIARDTHAPIAGARVVVETRAARGTSGSARPDVPWAITGEDGRFALAGLGPGPLSLRAAAEGRHGRIVAGLDVPDTGDPGDIVIDLAPTKPGEDPRLELAGIGVEMEPEGHELAIARVIAGGAAEEAGVRVGDRVLSVDGRAVSDLGYEGTVRAIRGPEGTIVEIALRGPEGGSRALAIRRRLLRL